MVHGTCLCGTLQYELDGPITELFHCHCSMCRKHHGAAFATLVGGPTARLRWVAGESHVVTYASSAKGVRNFCDTCGSVAPTLAPQTGYVPAGNLDGDLGQLSGAHIFVGSKAPWYVITDALPQHATMPPGWPEPQVERPTPPELDGAVHGSCLCGDVTFSVRGAPTRMMNCHCSRCRRGRSAAHASNAFYPRDAFTWLSGEAQVKDFKVPDAARFVISFCTRCGGGAPAVRDGVPFVLIPVAILDGDPGARPQAHIHVASKSSWYPITDEIPQHAAGPPT